MSVTTEIKSAAPAPTGSWPSLARRAMTFATLGGGIYVLLLLVLNATNWQGVPLLTRSTSFFVDPGGETFTSQRFQEAERHSPVDILFCGSSRAYLSFDPRPFQQKQLSSFNIGSSGQTPLNTYYLLKRYVPRLSPQLVAIEVYYVTLGLDGVECYYDLLANSTFNSSLAEMCIAVNSPKAFNATAGQLIERTAKWNFAPPIQMLSAARRYVGEGFVTTDEQSKVEFGAGSSPIEVRNFQIDYLAKSIELVRANGGEVVLIVPPLPIESIGSIANYDQVQARVESLARRESARLYDFSKSMNLDSHKDFFDASHLNSTGAARFSQAFCDSLTRDYTVSRRSRNDPTNTKAGLSSGLRKTR